MDTDQIHVVGAALREALANGTSGDPARAERFGWERVSASYRDFFASLLA